MIDKSSLLKSQGSLYLEFIPKDGLFHKMLLLSLMGFLTGWCNLNVVLFRRKRQRLNLQSFRPKIGQKAVTGLTNTYVHNIFQQHRLSDM